MQTLSSTPHYELKADDSARLFKFVRSKEALEAADVAAVFASMSSALRSYDVKSWRILFDMRAAPMKDDPELEQALRTHVGPLAASFGKAAILVKTAVGVLQVNRIARARGAEADNVFRDEEEALAWLLES